jgi:hypothetical protein
MGATTRRTQSLVTVDARAMITDLRPPVQASLIAARRPQSQRAVTEGAGAGVAEFQHEGGSPAEEYRSVCEFMRLYATLRFYRLALLLGTTGSIITALTSFAVRASALRVDMLRLGGLVISCAFLVMEFRATSQWVQLCERCNDLARVLRYQPVLVSSRWDPLATSGAGFYLHAAVTALWAASLALRFDLLG